MRTLIKRKNTGFHSRRSSKSPVLSKHEMLDVCWLYKWGQTAVWQSSSNWHALQTLACLSACAAEAIAACRTFAVSEGRQAQFASAQCSKALQQLSHATDPNTNIDIAAALVEIRAIESYARSWSPCDMYALLGV